RNHRQPGLGRVPSCDGSEGQRTAEPGENRRDVENQNDGAITQNGSAADQVAGNDFSGEGFDDQFFFADEAVHNETKALFGKTDDDHEIFCFFGARGLDRVNAIKLIEADEGEDLIAQAKDFALVHFVNFLMLEPSPLVEVMCTVPLRRSRTVRTTSMPTPRPETSVISEAVLKPGSKMRLRVS